MNKPTASTVICPFCYRPGEVIVDGVLNGVGIKESMRVNRVDSFAYSRAIRDMKVIHKSFRNGQMWEDWHDVAAYLRQNVIDQVVGVGMPIPDPMTDATIELEGSHIAIQHFDDTSGVVIVLVVDSGERRAIVLANPDQARELAAKLADVAGRVLGERTGSEPGIGSKDRKA